MTSQPLTTEATMFAVETVDPYFLNNAEVEEMSGLPAVPDEDWNWYFEASYVDPAELDDSCCRNPACGCGGRWLS